MFDIIFHSVISGSTLDQSEARKIQHGRLFALLNQSEARILKGVCMQINLPQIPKRAYSTTITLTYSPVKL